ncbi:MAG TPA: NAD(P)H nitroreductase [Peptococcaceae bacterium]|nr:NAD(P)H nitroreductase [Peptococcaceae bacterium]
MLDILYQRRSIRKYEKKPIEKEKVDQLIKAALLAPSARSAMSQRFIVVDDPVLLDKLAKVRAGASSFLKDATLGIVVIGDSSVSDVWVEDTSLAAIIIQLAAESLGLGSCWIQIRNRQHNEEVSAEEYIRNILGFPENLKVLCIISLGYPLERKPAKKDDELGFDRVSINGYNK